MTTTTRMSAPTPKSMPWPPPQRPAQATPVRRESVPAGAEKGGEPREASGIHPSYGVPYNEASGKYGQTGPFF